MTKININSTLAELVVQNPALTATMENYGFDYCCNGHNQLKIVVADAGLNIDEVVQALEAVGHEDTVNFSSMSLEEMADYIQSTHHDYLHDELPRLVELANKVAGVHGQNHPEVIEVAKGVQELIEDLEPHMQKEEMILFPMIRQLSGEAGSVNAAPGSVANPIRMMCMEHDHTAEILAKLREVTSGYQPPADACASYMALYGRLSHLETDTHLHIHRENNIMFPEAIEKEQALNSASSSA